MYEIVEKSEEMIPIPGFEGYYITKTGSVFSGRIKGKFIKNKLFNGSTGYLRLMMVKEGKKRNVMLHRLLAITFIPNPNNLIQINHKDGNKQNNSLDNLEWCTPLENLNHAVATGLRKIQYGEDTSNSRLTASQVINIHMLANGGVVKQKEIAEKYGISRSQVYSIKVKSQWVYVLNQP